MSGPELFRVEVTVDRPTSGMWHCGPNPSWVTVTHIPTMTQARAYHRSQHKAREAAMACVQMMLGDLLCENDQCSFPEAVDTRTPLPPVTAPTEWNAAIEAAAAAMRQSLVDAAHSHRGQEGKLSSAFFWAETYASNAILALKRGGA